MGVGPAEVGGVGSTEKCCFNLTGVAGVQGVCGPVHFIVGPTEVTEVGGVGSTEKG